VQQSAKPVTPSHIDRSVDRFGLDGRPTTRWDQTEASVRSTGVVMIDEDLECVRKMLRVQDQQPIQTFGPNRVLFQFSADLKITPLADRS
jgi:hypothetical protein